MKVVFVSSYFNHHQKPFCEEMYQMPGVDFTFVSTTVMREERRNLGYEQDDRPYVCHAYKSPEKRQEALLLIRDADVVIAGSAPEDLLVDRIRAGKLLFRYHERPFKRKPSFARKAYSFFRYRQRDLWKKRVYMLSAGAYTAGDYKSLGLYKNRTYKWGYFPTVKAYDTEALMANKNTSTLLWCGRFIDWKHPDDAVRLARMLKDHGYDFKLNFVGTGEMEQKLHELTQTLDLADRITFMGAMNPEEVRVQMEGAGIYLFTSDRCEGWGAVLNESMNSGCAVVTDKAAGSAPYLIQDGENGCLYPSGDVQAMFEKVKMLLDTPAEQKRLGLSAYRTVQDIWNAPCAAKRLVCLAEAILAGNEHPDLYEDGPCSIASVIS